MVALHRPCYRCFWHINIFALTTPHIFPTTARQATISRPLGSWRIPLAGKFFKNPHRIVRSANHLGSTCSTAEHPRNILRILEESKATLHHIYKPYKQNSLLQVLPVAAIAYVLSAQQCTKPFGHETNRGKKKPACFMWCDFVVVASTVTTYNRGDDFVFHFVCLCIDVINCTSNSTIEFAWKSSPFQRPVLIDFRFPYKCWQPARKGWDKGCAYR